MSQVKLEDIKAAHDRISDHLNKTNLVTSKILDQEISGEVFLKPEQLQKTGSFKIRGAMSAMTLLNKEELKNGVIAYSSGNHAQGVAYAAKLLKTSAVIIMPKDAPKIKIDNTKSYGAKVVFYDRQKDSREDIGEAIASKEKRSLIRPFDSCDVIAGQGTAALEASEEIITTHKAFDSAIICTSGGGFAAGTGIVLKNYNQDCKIYTAEPSEWNDHEQSFIANKKISVTNSKHGICDALESPSPGRITFPINKLNKVKGLSVDNTDIIEAMRFAYREFNFVLEPSGAVALACLRSAKNKFKGQKTLIMLSGGNISIGCFNKYISN